MDDLPQDMTRLGNELQPRPGGINLADPGRAGFVLIPAGQGSSVQGRKAERLRSLVRRKLPALPPESWGRGDHEPRRVCHKRYQATRALNFIQAQSGTRHPAANPLWRTDAGVHRDLLQSSPAGGRMRQERPT
jgi:hypothetical protein